MEKCKIGILIKLNKGGMAKAGTNYATRSIIETHIYGIYYVITFTGTLGTQ